MADTANGKEEFDLPEKSEDEKQWARQLLDDLYEHYPEPNTALNHRNPFELLIATILSAQTTDERVNEVTEELFELYPTPEKLAEAYAQARKSGEDLQHMLRDLADLVEREFAAMIDGAGAPGPRNWKGIALRTRTERWARDIVRRLRNGDLTVPRDAQGIVVFAHGSGSSRHSKRNQFVARILRDSGIAVLLLDLLTPSEEEVDVRTLFERYIRAIIGHFLEEREGFGKVVVVPDSELVEIASAPAWDLRLAPLFLALAWQQAAHPERLFAAVDAVDDVREAVEDIGGGDTAEARYRVGHAHYVEGRRAFTSAMGSYEDRDWLIARGDFDVRAYFYPRWLLTIAFPLSFGLMAVEFARFVVGREILHEGRAGIHE